MGVDTITEEARFTSAAIIMVGLSIPDDISWVVTATDILFIATALYRHRIIGVIKITTDIALRITGVTTEVAMSVEATTATAVRPTIAAAHIVRAAA